MTKNGSGVHHAIPYFMSPREKLRFARLVAVNRWKTSMNRLKTGKLGKEEDGDMDGMKMMKKSVNAHPVISR